MIKPIQPKRIFVKALLPYLMGIGLAIGLPIGGMLWQLGAILLVISILLVLAHNKIKPLLTSNLTIWGLLFFGWIAYVGVLNVHWASPKLHHQHYTHTANTPGLLIVQIEELPFEMPNTFRVVANIKARKQGDSLVPVTGKVMLLLPLDSASAKLNYGDELAINSKLQPIPPSLNPYEFDYSQYLANKHIYHQLAPKPTRWYATGNNAQNRPFAWLYATRNQALTILKNRIPDKALNGVAAAILLGYNHSLDNETRQRYTLTGSMHVLAVSGMHVGLLCFMLWGLLQPLKAMNKLWLRLTLLLIVVWFYALITGMSASVLRAALMFSLYAIGETIKRKPDSLNIVAASALILLLWQPMHILDVGFQLSYLAVLGIIFFYNPLRNLWAIKQPAPRFLWEGTCISIAAQLATLPMILYYFHQLPLYALVANVGMLILAPAAMISGLLLLLFNWVPGLGWLLGKLLFISLWLMNETLGLIAQWPYVVWNAIYTKPTEMAVMMGLVVCTMLATQMRLVKPMLGFGCLLVVLLAGNNLKLYQQKTQQQLIVYQYPDFTTIGNLNGLEGKIWADCEALEDTTKMERSVFPFLHANGNEKLEIDGLNKTNTNEYGMLGGKRIALLRRHSRRNVPNIPLKVDYLVVANNPSISMIQVKKVYQAKTIILDGSNNIKAAERWMQECRVLGLDCHNTRNGAFIASW
jgi:competence protein ComEC